MNTDDVWVHIHQERSDLADALEGLSDEQWSTPSYCTGWSVAETSGHVLAAAEQTRLHFFTSFASAGFNFDTFADRDAKALGTLERGELVGRLRARTSTTNRPPAPVVTMLGEIVVHGEDIRRPLGLTHDVPAPALVAVADNFKKTNLLIGSKKRIAGLRVVADDAEWSNGDGPEVTGPLTSLLLAMTGRAQAFPDLSGDGVETLASRV